MEFSGDFTVDGTPDELWKYFTDPDILKDCAPGCNKMELESPSQIIAGLTVGVGSVKPSFDVEATVTECDRPNRLEIQAVGEASRNSFEVTAWQELTDNGDGTTTVTWQANAEISGIIASMGERAIGSVATKLVNEFFQDLEDHVNAGTPAESQLQAASSDQIEAVEQRAAEATAASGGGITGTVINEGSKIASAAGPHDKQSFAAGIILGLVGGSLWNRLRGKQPRAETHSPSASSENSGDQSAPVKGSSPSLLTLALTGALGAAGAVIWMQSQSEPTTQQESTATETSAGDGVPTDSSEDGESRIKTSDPVQANLAESDNPLDRLESRP